MKYNPSRYCGNGLPRFPLPPGYYLVHNQGAFCDAGLFGFRSWVQEGRSNLVRCHCDFGGTLQKVDGPPLKKAEVPKHYRIRDSVLRKSGRLEAYSQGTQPGAKANKGRSTSVRRKQPRPKKLTLTFDQVLMRRDDGRWQTMAQYVRDTTEAG
jgi:hypothetical protein